MRFNPFLQMTERQSLSNEQALDLFRNAGKPKKTREQEQLDLVLSGNIKEAEAIRKNDLAKRRAQAGDTKSVAQKRKETQGTWENAVADARARLNIKPGDAIDGLLKSALWVMGEEDGKVSREALRKTVALMQSENGRKELQARIERYKNPQAPEKSVGALTPEQVTATNKEAELQRALGESGLRKTFQAIEGAQKKIEANPFLDMVMNPVKTGVDATVGRFVPGAGDTAKDIGKSIVSETLTAPPRIGANLLKLVSTVSPEQKGYAALELVVDSLDIAGLAGGAIKANKSIVKAALKESLEAAGDIPPRIVEQAVSAIDDIPDNDFAKAIDELAQAPEVQRGLPQNTPDIPKATTTSMREPEIPLGSPPNRTAQATDQPAQEAGFFSGGNKVKVYHGGADIEDNVLRRYGGGGRSDMGGIFVTTDKGYASRYVNPGGALYETELDASSLFDFNNPEHIKALAKNAVESGEYDTIDDFMEELSRQSNALDEWEVGSGYLEYVEGAGFKGAKLKEPGGVESYVVFEDLPVNRVKSQPDNIADSAKAEPDVTQTDLPRVDAAQPISAKELSEIDPEDLRLDPFADEFDEVLARRISEAIGDGDPDSAGQALDRFQDALRSEEINFNSEYAQDLYDRLSSPDFSSEWKLWRKNPKTGRYVPMPQNINVLEYHIDPDGPYDFINIAFDDLAEYTDRLYKRDNYLFTQGTGTGDYYAQSKYYKKKGVIAGSDKTPRGAMRATELLTHEYHQLDARNAANNSIIKVPAKAVKEYLKDQRALLKGADGQEALSIVAKKYGLTLDEANETIEAATKAAIDTDAGVGISRRGGKTGAGEVTGEAKSPTQVDAGTPNKVDNANTGVLSDAVERAKARKAERAAKRAQREAEGIVEAKSGFSDEDFLELVDDVIIAFGEVVNWTEANVKAFLRERGAEDRFDEVKRLAEKDIDDPEWLGKAQADTAAIRQERGLPEYQRTPRTLDEVAQNAENVDVQKTVKDILDNPRPMTDAEEYATLQAVDANDRAYRDLTNQYNQAVESGDMATANTIADEIERIDAQMVELAEAADKAGTEWGRAGRARQLETLRSREPSVIRYRQYKANGGNPSAADKQRIDDLLEQLEAQKKATADAEARAKAKRAPRVQDKVTAARPPKKVDELIQKNQSDLEEWRKRWAKATPVNKRGGSQSISLAIEGAYYITKGEFLKGVKKLDDLIAAVRKEGLTADDISDDDIISQVEKVLADTKPNRRPPKGPTVKSLRDEIAKRTGRVRETKKAPRTPKTGNTPAAKAERAYRTTVDSLQKDLEKLQAATSLLRAADPTGVEFLKLEDDIRKLSAKINRGRAYGKDTLQVGTTGFQGDEVTNLRESLDKLRRDFGFDEQSVNAPGPSYENVIKNIEDIEANKTLSPKQKQDALREQYRILNQGRAEGEGFFMDGKSAIEDPVIAQARGREDAVMAKINRELARQSRAAEKAAMPAFEKMWTNITDFAGGIKTLSLSGEAGFIGRQAWAAIGSGRFKVFNNALKDMKNSVKQEMFDWTIADLKQNPWYQKAVDSGLQISDPSSKVREEDFMPEIFEDWAQSGNKAVAKTGETLSKYSGINERLYTSFINRVRMDLFEEFAEAAGKRGVLTDKDLEGFAIIINDMTGKSTVPPKAEQVISVTNKLLISARYYLSRLKLTTGASLYAGGSKAAQRQMATEYARFLGTYATLLSVTGYASEKLNLGIDVELDPRSTDFGRITMPNGAVLEFDAGTRPFINLLWRNGITAINDAMMKTGDDRKANYVSRSGNEYRDSDMAAKSFATKLGGVGNFIAIRSNPLWRFALADFSEGKMFGRETNIYRELGMAPVPINLRNIADRAFDGESADLQGSAFLLEMLGLGGDANRSTQKQTESSGISEEQLRELGAID